MIVRNLHVVRVTVLPPEAKPVLNIDTDAVLPRSVASQRFQPVCRWRRKVPQFLSAVDLYQFPQRGVRNSWNLLTRTCRKTCSVSLSLKDRITRIGYNV